MRKNNIVLKYAKLIADYEMLYQNVEISFKLLKIAKKSPDQVPKYIQKNVSCVQINCFI